MSAPQITLIARLSTSAVDARRGVVRLHPEVALYLVEQEPNFLRQLEKQTGLELEVRDDPMMRLDEFRMMARPAGRDVTEQYAVA